MLSIRKLELPLKATRYVGAAFICRSPCDRDCRALFRGISGSSCAKMPSSKDKYTDPKLRDEVKEDIQESDKGGGPGQWSARKVCSNFKIYGAAVG